MKSFFSTSLNFLSWSFPPAIIALVAGVALMQGIEHDWVYTVLLVSLVINCIIALFSTGVCMALYESLVKKREELDRSNECFSANNHKYNLLSAEVEKLTGMREIQMAAHIDSFSDLLRNILKITHIATESRALTIYLESREDIGSTFPKAHMRWEPENSVLPGELFIFFNEEIVLDRERLEYISGFSVNQLTKEMATESGEVRGLIQINEKPVGEILYRNPFRTVSNLDEDIKNLLDWCSTFELITRGVNTCWQRQIHVTHPTKDAVFISVPILSQGLMVGVIAAENTGEFVGGEFNSELTQLRNTLLDYGRNIGQPLKKEELYEQAIKDGLTGLFNKTHYESQLTDHFHRMVRYEREFSFIFLDIDHFKKVNDNYGHLTGDLALKAVAKIIVENVRKSDMAFRIGGEELAILLVETDIDQAAAVAEKLRSVIEETEFPKEGGGHIRFTSSFGVASLTEDMKDPNDLVSAADKAVYAAKDRGRNRVVAWMDGEMKEYAEALLEGTAAEV